MCFKDNMEQTLIIFYITFNCDKTIKKCLFPHQQLVKSILGGADVAIHCHIATLVQITGSIQVCDRVKVSARKKRGLKRNTGAPYLLTFVSVLLQQNDCGDTSSRSQRTLLSLSVSCSNKDRAYRTPSPRFFLLGKKMESSQFTVNVQHESVINDSFGKQKSIIQSKSTSRP